MKQCWACAIVLLSSLHLCAMDQKKGPQKNAFMTESMMVLGAQDFEDWTNVVVNPEEHLSVLKAFARLKDEIKAKEEQSGEVKIAAAKVIEELKDEIKAKEEKIQYLERVSLEEESQLKLLNLTIEHLQSDVQTAKENAAEQSAILKALYEERFKHQAQAEKARRLLQMRTTEYELNQKIKECMHLQHENKRKEESIARMDATIKQQFQDINAINDFLANLQTEKGKALADAGNYRIELSGTNIALSEEKKANEALSRENQILQSKSQKALDVLISVKKSACSYDKTRMVITTALHSRVLRVVEELNQ